MFVKCKFLDETGELQGKAYTYSASDDSVVGEIATTPEAKKVVIVEINVSPDSVKGFEDRIKGVLKVIDVEVEPTDEMEIDKRELIIVKQIPVITEQFRLAGEEVKRRVADVDSLVCTEENKQSVKKARARFRKELMAFEERYKEVEKEILEPWNRVKDAYRDFISMPYAEGDKRLKAKIDTIENEQKRQKLEDIKLYFKEYALSKHIDIATWKQAGIKVGLSDSVKALKEQVNAFIDRIESDLQLIETQEHKEEILVEYRRVLNASQAITAVAMRHKAVEEQKIRQAEIEEKKAAEAEAIKRVKDAMPAPLAPPIMKATSMPEKEYPVAFKTTGTKDRLTVLVRFMKDNGFEYQQIPLKNIIESEVM